MARVVAVANLKGGIGKTTTVVNVGAGLALKGARVLLVDTDAQGNLAMALGVHPRRTLYDVLVDGAPVERCIIEARPGLDLLPADATLLGAQPIIARRPDWSRVLAQAIQPVVGSYDFVLIDSAGSLTPLNVNALVCAHDVIAPTTVEHFAVKSLELLIAQLGRIKGSAGHVRMIIPTMYDPRVRQSGELLAMLRARYGDRVTPPVRVNVRLSEAPALGKTIYEYDPQSRGAIDYAMLVEHISRAFGFTARPSQPSPDPMPPKPIAAPSRPASTVAPETCPHCGRALQHTSLAGYRVSYCVQCRFKKQELVRDRG
ncbi:MAG: ParA family protein [Roseiflexus sp.]|nr:ParA family protein [Roseiflexus sp.]MCS7288460.1 ParA family protein [Roseiflexus sp.]MDW8233281.1 ParA family protein [Roseiflexaceae bacterium]